MILPLVCALLLSPAVSAVEPALKPAKVVNVEGISDQDSMVLNDSRYMMTKGESSVGLWDMSALKQIAHIELPDAVNLRTETEGDYTTSSLEDVSADGKWALVGMQMKWTGEHRIGAFELLLISVPDQRIARVLVKSSREKCNDEYSITGDCPALNGARFSPDGTKVLYWTQTNTYAEHLAGSKPSIFGHGEWEGVTHRHRMTLTIADQSGSVVQRMVYEGVRDDRQTDSRWVYTPPLPAAGFLKDGRPALIQADGAGCVVKDLHDKQISFLEDCSAELVPGFDKTLGMAVAYGGKYVVWDPLTGTVKYNQPQALDASRIVADATLSVRAEFLFQSPSSTATLRVTDAATGKVLSERLLELPFPDIKPASLAYDHAARRFVLRGWTQTPDGKSPFHLAIYKLGDSPAAEASAETAASALIDVDSPPATKAKLDPDAYAVVIGVEKYRQDGIPAVDYAARDASTVYAYLTQAMGFDPKNVVLLTDEHATRTDFQKNLGSWLKNRVGPKSRVFVYYAGHGSPNPETGQGFLMPYEADPAYLEDTAYPLWKLYASLGKLPTKDVTVVLDACFSGQGGRSLIAKGTRPLVSVVQSKAEPNTVVLAAAGSNQVSASYPEERHGLLTYYLLAGLHGEADAKHDGRITASELYAYVRPAVERAAKLQNVEQTPNLMSPPGAAERPWIVLAPKK